MGALLRAKAPIVLKNTISAMKKFLTNLCPLLVLALLFNLNFAAAQGELGTNDDGFVVQIKTPSSIAQTIFYGFEAGVCQWVGQSSNNGAAPWGADVTEELCGQVVWAKDSLACVPGTKDLTGKIALVRRGTCNFSLKVYHAQQRGAKAVIVLNNYANPNDGPCTTTSGTLLFGGMAAGDSAAAVKIPAIFLEQLNAEQIDGALAAGEEVNICFSFPRMISATAASMYATPLSQVGTMGAITATYNNRSGAAQTNVNLKAEFFDPSGNLTGTRNYNMPFVAPGVDSFVVFQPYEAPAAKGVHSVRFTNDKSTESIDTLIVNFEHTDFTFATDNYKVNPNGVGPSNDQFATASFYIQSGGLCLTGPNPGKATYASFGIANIQDVYVPSDPSANIIGIAVYRADVDGDGLGDLSSSFIDDLSAGLVSYVEYEMTGNETNDQLIHVKLIDLNSGDEGIELDADDAYYVSLIYDGTAAGTGKCVRFLSTGDVPYASFTGYPTTPLYLGQLFGGGWSGATVVQRLQMEGFKPTSAAEPKILAESKVKLTPNPANEFVNLEFNLDAVNPSVAVSILDGNARKVTETRVQRDVQNGVMNFNVEQLPSGVYYVWVRTAEGSTMKKVSICH
jgi:PA domain.